MKKHFLTLGIISFMMLGACDSDRRVADGEGFDENTETVEADQIDEDTLDGELDDTAEDFMTTAAISGMFEVQSSQIAADKATNAQVKEYAQMMVDHHGQVNNTLKNIAQELNYTLPTQLDEEHQEKLNKLQNLSGSEFDNEYVNLMVAAHDKDVSLFEDREDDVENAELKQFITATLPTLRQHNQRINEIDEAVN